MTHYASVRYPVCGNWLSAVFHCATWVLVLSMAAPAAAAESSATDFRSQRPHPAVARIIVPEQQAVAYGSGTLIDVRENFGLVITNWHVVRDAQGPIEVLFPNGQHSKARALKVDADWDLAALVIWRPRVDPIPIADRAPQPGEELTICGYGHGIYRSVTGKCTGYLAPQLDLPQQMVELDVQARQGDSGGPIFNRRGELAGVLFGAGQGTTLGSFNGRVGSFLATLAPDIGAAAAPSIEVAGNAPAASAVLKPVDDGEAVEVGEPQWRPPAAVLAAAWAEAERSEEATAPVAETLSSDGSPPAPVGKIAGGLLFAHAKTVLAVIGVISIVMQAVRVAR